MTDELDLNALDPGIREYVRILREHGVETVESCEGGEGHSFPEPTIRFLGVPGEEFRAYGVAKIHGLPVTAIRRAWSTVQGDPEGPVCEIVFSRLLGERRR